MAFSGLDDGAGFNKSPISDINVTPLVDVMLVLLVIFIITAPLLTSTLQLKLPQSSIVQTSTSPQAIPLTLNKNQQFYWGADFVTKAELLQRLRTRARQNPQTQVQLRADAQVPYGDVVRLMDLIQAAGLSHIGFITTAKESR